MTSTADFAHEQYLYLTTTGRTSGLPREIEIWFGARETTLYLLAGGGPKAHWVRNIQADPAVKLRVGTYTFHARGRIVSDPDEDAMARSLLLTKYQPDYSDDLSTWGRAALPVALDLGDAVSPPDAE